MTENIITFHGLSNVGKSTLANRLNYMIGGYMTTPLNKFKRFLEEVYQFPKGSLDTQKGKDECRIGNQSAGKVLRDSFHFWQDRDPAFACRCMLSEMRNAYAFENIILESLRFPQEIKAIVEFAVVNDCKIIPIHVKSLERGIRFDTDAMLYDCLNTYPDDVVIHEVHNDKNMQDTIQEIYEIWRSNAETSALQKYADAVRSLSLD